jgi:hypothetical protein
LKQPFLHPLPLAAVTARSRCGFSTASVDPVPAPNTYHSPISTGDRHA